MKAISFSDFETEQELYRQAGEVLEGGGLVCVPAPTGYKIMADLSSPSAITAMLQAKRRVKNAPALVFVPGREWVAKVAASVCDKADILMRRFWPGSVTLLFKASEDLNPKVRKPLTKAKGWIGVRIPGDDIPYKVVEAFGRPVLVSSANIAKKKGSHSVAQVKKNFGRTVDLLIDTGDLVAGESSTLVDVSEGEVTVIRAGVITEQDIMDALAG